MVEIPFREIYAFRNLSEKSFLHSSVDRALAFRLAKGRRFESYWGSCDCLLDVGNYLFVGSVGHNGYAQRLCNCCETIQRRVAQEDLKTVVFHVFWTFYHRVIVKYFCDTPQRWGTLIIRTTFTWYER